jgi:hypothetical protein
MSVPDPATTDWVPLAYGPAGSGVDYKGDWVPGTEFEQGDVVIHNGVQYLAVNSSTNSTPPPTSGLTAPVPIVGIGTVFPGSPLNGEEFIIVDSLTTPTYSWRFRYVSSITDIYKWIFIGGSFLQAAVGDANEEENATGAALAAWANLATIGPTVTPPVSGYYDVTIGFRISQATTGNPDLGMSYAIGAVAALDVDAARSQEYGQSRQSVMRNKRKFLTAGQAVVAKYKQFYDQGWTLGYTNRHISILPVRAS